MIKQYPRTKQIFNLAIISVLMGLTGTAAASGFQLFEQNAVNMGDFGAGGAAIAEDASTAYYNPAGLIRIPDQQLVASGDVVLSGLKFNGTSTWSQMVPPQFSRFFPSYTETANGVQGGRNVFIPAFHYAAPMSDRLVIAISAASPFGLATDYSQTSALRYAATESELKVIDLSPSFGFAVTKCFSVGAGFDADRMDVTLNSVGGIPIAGSAPTTFDTLSKNSDSAWGYGWHAGALYQFSPATRIGLAYRSRVFFDLDDGRSRFIGPLAGEAISGQPVASTLISNDLSSRVTLPPTTTLSAYHDINCHWAVDGTVNYTQWDIYNNNLVLENVQAVALALPSMAITPTLINPVIPQNFHNTWRFALGGIYTPVQCFSLRAGVGYDQTPTNNTDRDIRLPDGNRFAVALGAHYQIIKPIGIDVGWTHFFTQKVNVNYTVVTGGQAVTVNGNFHNRADVLGAQLTWDFC